MNPLIQLRGAFYLIVLVATCATPFALAQRAGTKLKPAVAKRVAANAAQFSATARSADPATTQHAGTSSTLWYNGDFNGVSALANEENTSIGSGEFASVYDDFILPTPGWNVTAVFSDNLISTNVTGATWEIR